MKDTTKDFLLKSAYLLVKEPHQCSYGRLTGILDYIVNSTTENASEKIEAIKFLLDGISKEKLQMESKDAGNVDHTQQCNLEKMGE